MSFYCFIYFLTRGGVIKYLFCFLGKYDQPAAADLIHCILEESALQKIDQQTNEMSDVK